MNMDCMGLGRRSFLFGLACSGLMVSSPVFARRGRRFRSGQGMRGAAQQYGSGVLTRDALESCVRLERAIEQRRAELDVSEIEVRRSEDQINRLAAEIRRSELSVDRYSQLSIDKHNKLVHKYNINLENHRRTIKEFNSQLDLSNKEINVFNETCANKSFYERDMKYVEGIIGE